MCTLCESENHGVAVDNQKLVIVSCIGLVASVILLMIFRIYKKKFMPLLAKLWAHKSKVVALKNRLGAIGHQDAEADTDEANIESDFESAGELGARLRIFVSVRSTAVTVESFP